MNNRLAENTRIIRILQRLYLLLLCAGIVLMVGTIARVSLYTVFVSDDYWHAMNTGFKSGSLIARIGAAWKDNVDLYMTDHGSYSEFFLSLFNPVTSTGFAGLHVIMVINVLFFFSSMVFLLYAIIEYALGRKTSRVIFQTILFCVIFVMTQYDAFEQVFYWYTGATNYSFPVSFANICLGLTLSKNVERKHQVARMILAAFCSFMACGGVIQIGGVLCYVLLVKLVADRIKEGSFSKSQVVVFAVSFVATFINFIAPGNYVRMDAEGTEDSGFISCFTRTIDYFGYCMRYLFVNKNYLLIFLVLVIVGGAVAYKLKETWQGYMRYVVLSILMLLVPFITIFPVLFGYGANWMPNRCFFITIFTIDITLGNMAMVIGYGMWCSINKIIDNVKIRNVIFGIAAVAFMSLVVTNNFSPFDYNIAKINKQLWDGQYQQNYREVRELIDSFADLKGQDVIVDVPIKAEEIRNFYTFFLTEDPGAVKVNVAVAWRYDLKSICNSRTDN